MLSPRWVCWVVTACSLICLITSLAICKLMVQNAAARLVVGLRKYDHISASMMDLHWLPVKQRIQFKVLLLAYKAVIGEGPQYLSDMFIPTGSNYSLRSDYNDLFKVPKSNKKCCGDRAFSIAAPKLWNDLPWDLKYAHDTKDFKATSTPLFSDIVI